MCIFVKWNGNDNRQISGIEKLDDSGRHLQIHAEVTFLKGERVEIREWDYEIVADVDLQWLGASFPDLLACHILSNLRCNGPQRRSTADTKEGLQLAAISFIMSMNWTLYP